MDKIRSESVDRLFRGIRSLETEEECYAFFEDLCTIKEIQDMAQRLDTAILLHEGKNYLEITDKAKVSAATISRVNRCLKYGTGGYQKVIEQLLSEEEEKKS